MRVPILSLALLAAIAWTGTAAVAAPELEATMRKVSENGTGAEIGTVTVTEGSGGRYSPPISTTCPRASTASISTRRATAGRARTTRAWSSRAVRPAATGIRKGRRNTRDRRVTATSATCRSSLVALERGHGLLDPAVLGLGDRLGGLDED